MTDRLTPRSTIYARTAPHRAALHRTAQHRTAQHRIALQRTSPTGPTCLPRKTSRAAVTNQPRQENHKVDSTRRARQTIATPYSLPLVRTMGIMVYGVWYTEYIRNGDRMVKSRARHGGALHKLKKNEKSPMHIFHQNMKYPRIG